MYAISLHIMDRGWIKKCSHRPLSAFAFLDHTAKQFVDLVLAISEVSAVNVVVVLLAPSASRCVQFEGPEEVVDLLEDASNGVQLVDHVFDALNVVSVAQLALDNEVIGDRNATTSVLQNKASLVSCLRLDCSYLPWRSRVCRVNCGSTSTMDIRRWCTVGRYATYWGWPCWA